jgi:hypothetical protein
LIGFKAVLFESRLFYSLFSFTEIGILIIISKPIRRQECFAYSGCSGPVKTALSDPADTSGYKKPRLII